MEFKFKERWTRDEISFYLFGLLDNMEENGVEYLVDVSLSFRAEDCDFDERLLLTDDDYPVEVIEVENPRPSVKTESAPKSRKTKSKAPVVDIANFKRRKD